MVGVVPEGWWPPAGGGCGVGGGWGRQEDAGSPRSPCTAAVCRYSPAVAQ